MNRYLKSLLIFGLAVATASPALAENPKVNVQVFRPAAHHGDMFTVSTTDVARHMRWSAGFLANYGQNALVFLENGGTEDIRQEVVKSLATVDFVGSLALMDKFSVALAFPLHVFQDGDYDGAVYAPDPEPSSFAPGDLRFSFKYAFMQREEKGEGFGLAAVLDFNFPTGDSDSFVSDGFLIQPGILVDYQVGPFLAAVNLSYRLRLDDQVLDPFGTEVGDEFIFKIGGRYEVVEDLLQVIGEVYGGSSDFTTENNTHLEGVLGGRLLLADRTMAITVGGGSGFTQGFGNTKFRVFAGFTFSPEVVIDQDGDGILDEADKCPLQPEDFDKFQDADGCPDPDNDGDGVADVDDKCPNDAEDKDGFEDTDGCPDPDNDGDGIDDSADKCLNVAEDKDGFEDTDGCPDLDNDGDGFPDVTDKCPLEKEVLNGFEDDDGCPDETLAKVVGEKIIILDKIYFDTGRAKIKEASYPVVQAVSGIMKSNPQIKSIRIEGHTDDRGSVRSNKRLSQKRADSVMAWLVADGIAASRLTGVGYGEDAPAHEGKSKQAREKNRRVEFTITGQ
ncbi:MAG: outer membrane protein OmpA-like peptidoglycan-associated protein [Myxococcota bacterium]|jgi:outer membrane protein OmpA-like peptidoglycan-associated protein